MAFSLKLNQVEARRVYLTKLKKQKLVLDEVMLTFFEAPHSYNGENILELSVHGNPLNIEAILDFLSQRFNLRQANPGEFTLRALKNGKMGLSQVEGLDLLLHADSAYALDQGQSLLRGELHSAYQNLYNTFLRLKSSLELFIDFSDDVGEEAAQLALNQSLSLFHHYLEQLFRRIQGDGTSLLSPEIVLYGETNAGKSSLFNALLDHDRAIVSAEAGTTRDYLSESLFIEGIKFTLIDTAGLRETVGKIEKEGIKKTHSKTSQAFFTILVVNPFESEAPEEANYDLLIFTHQDQIGFKKPHQGLGLSTQSLSAENRQEIFQAIYKKYQSLRDKQPLLLGRHRQIIEVLYQDLLQFNKLVKKEQDMAILSSELEIMGQKVYELIGIIAPDEVLNDIFSNFCIGK